MPRAASNCTASETSFLIGDSGGSLNGLKTVSINLNREWDHTDTRVFFLGAFTRGDRFRDWLIAQGETVSQIGYHAGIMDTSRHGRRPEHGQVGQTRARKRFQ